MLVRLMIGMTTLLLPSAGLAAEVASDAPQPNIFLQLGPLILLMVVFFFFTSRSQKKKQKQHESMLASISRGDTVVTAGGFFGKVYEVLDDSYVIEIAEGTRARVLKGSVSSKREGGDPARPRKLKKKRRVVRSETTETGATEKEAAERKETAERETTGKREAAPKKERARKRESKDEEAALPPAEEAAPPKAMDEGVSVEENEALMMSDFDKD